MEDKELLIINKFINTIIPYYFKIDFTDNILFLEDLEFDVCKPLIRGTNLSKEDVNDLISRYSKFLSQINLSDFDEELIAYLKLVNSVIGVALGKVCEK